MSSIDIFLVTLHAKWQWLRFKMATINYHDRRVQVAFGLTGLLVIALVGWWLFKPQTLVSGDYDPFASRAEYEAFMKDNPLMSTASPENVPFRMSTKVRADKTALYTFVLRDRPIKAVMSEADSKSYLADLEKTQQQAIDWIKSQGQNPDKLFITWSPNPEVMRGKLLGTTNKPNPQKVVGPPTATPIPSPTVSGDGRFPTD